jgi:hypothetical protein
MPPNLGRLRKRLCIEDTMVGQTRSVCSFSALVGILTFTSFMAKFNSKFQLIKRNSFLERIL